MARAPDEISPLEISVRLSLRFSSSRVSSAFPSRAEKHRRGDEPCHYRPSRLLISCALRTDHRATRCNFRPSRRFASIRDARSAISRARAINVSPISRDRDAIAARAQATALRVDGSSRNRVVKMAAAPTSATLFMNGKRVIIVRHGPRETGGGDGMARCAIFERVRDRTSRRRDGYGLPLSRSRATVSGSVRSVYEFSPFSTFTSDLRNASVIAPTFNRSKHAMETRSPGNKINVKR